MAWICDKNGNHRCEIKKLSYNGTFMEVSSITVTVESAEPIAFAIGDYIDWDYDGLRYTLDTAAGVEKQARRSTIGKAFVYDNLVFLSPLQAAGNADFLDVVLGNTVDFMTNTEFSFYGTAWDYAKRLEANLERLYGSGSWKVRIWTNGTCYDASPATGIDTGAWENKLVDVSGIKCLGGFQQIYDLWGCAYVFSVVNGVNYVDFYDDFELYAKAWKVGNDDKIFAYGKGNGLYKIRHTPDADHVLVTRLRAYGSGENIPANYYLNSPDYHVDGNESSELAISHLMLPASQWTKSGVKHPSNAYLEANTDLYGVREGVVLWDGSDSELGEIKPSIYGLTIGDLLNLMTAGDSYRPVEAKWPDTTQRIDKIITGAAPTDNGAVAEAGYDFTVVESSGSLTAHSFGATQVNRDVEFYDIVMGTTPSVSHLAEYRIVPTSNNKVAVSFDVPDTIVSSIDTVTAYLNPYIGGTKIEDALMPCTVSEETIDNTVDDVHYTKRYNISLLDSTGNPIVFSTMLTGAVTFRIVGHINFYAGMVPDNSITVIRNEYAVNFNLLRGNKAIEKFFSVTIPQVGFDLVAAVTGNAKLCMRSRANQPREFAIVPASVRYNESNDTWSLRCKRSVDQSIKTYFPNSDAVIATGDEYYLSGIAMPSLYVEIAAGKLLEAARAWLALHSKPRMLSSVDVDNKIMAVEGIVLKEGMALPITDADLDIEPGNQESRIIDNIRIEEGSDSIRTFSITLRDKKEKSSLDQAIRGATSNFATNTSVAEAIGAVDNRDHGSLSGRDMPNQHPISSITGLEEALAALTFFEADGNGNVKLKDEYGGLWAKGFLTAGGIGQSDGGGGGGIDLARLWQSLQNNDATTDIYNVYKISTAHLPRLGSGLAYTDNREAGTSLETTLSIADGYKLPTVEEWNSIAGNVGALQSLQAQIDAVASRDNFDELTASAIFSDVIAATDIYGSLHGNAETATNAQTAATAEKATKDASGNVITSYYAKASDLTSVSNRVSTLESRQNWDNIFGLDENGNVYVKKNGSAARGFWTYGFVTAGGVGSSGGGGGDVDLTRLWKSMQNQDTINTYNDYKISTAHLPALGTGLAYADNQGSGSSLATTLSIAAGYKLPTTEEWANVSDSLNGLQALQAQIDSVASRDCFDELGASALFADVLTASEGYFSELYGVLHGNADTATSATSAGSAGSATTASYLVGSSYGAGAADKPVYFSGGLPVALSATVGSASLPVFLSAGTITSCTAASIFSSLTSSAATNLSVTVAGQNRTVTLYATYDSASENIASAFSIVSSALQSLQSQIDSVATRNDFDELVASVIYADTISAASFYGALHGNADTATNATNATYATYDTASENIALNFSTVGAALKSLQAQIDSVAASRTFDELTVGAGYFDMLSVGANLDVAGTIYSVKGIYSSGYVTAGAVGASSDRRLKNNIVTISKERAEDVIMALNPCEWVWNEKNAVLEGRKFAGFIAQDVQKVLPDTVLDSREELLMFHNVFHGYEVRMLQDHERRIKALELANE